MLTYLETKKNRVDLSRAIPLEKPFTIIFEPICACNFKCNHCYYSYPDIRERMPYGKMSDETFQHLLNDLKKWCSNGQKIRVIRIIGFGEPLLNNNVGKWVNQIYESKVAERIEITTNGSLLTKDVAMELIKGHLDYIRISVYATNQRDFKKTTNSNLDFDIIRKNLEYLQEQKRKHGTERPFVYVKMLDNGNSEENNVFREIYKDVADEIAIEKKHSWLLGSSDKRVICPQPFKMLFVRWNGDCCSCDPDYCNNTVVGNALQTSLEKIWNGKKMYDFRKMQIEGKRWENESCKTCSFLNENYVLDNIDNITVECLGREPNE